ncbi:PREDICTED: histidine ammonia-lyase-like [Acropora digitifera]|uniref:histidine ammonia-lyase-like n=1 Tax=Acropora digitifera TaxID=70779 RepID=UPI00077AD8B7|nr:PREDICTED: histidine ammonia-lyase-like [Acropora digitifera]
MRLSVRFNDKWLVIPCGEGDKSVEWLIEETMRRSETPNLLAAQNYKAVLVESGGTLRANDPIKEVLNDSDFVHISNRESPVEHALPEKIFAKRKEHEKFLELDGCSLSPAKLVELGQGKLKIKLTEDAEKNVTKSRKLLDDIVRENKVVYGVTTGFGKFARVIISHDNLKELQQNLIKSHAAGIGPPLSLEHTRMLFALRINVLAKGYSGISLKTLNQLIEAFNERCVPWVPEQGTVGASGDLAPLAHLALALLGEGQMWSPRSGWADASLVLKAHGLRPLDLEPKEGLALINGTQLITSLGAEGKHTSVNDENTVQELTYILSVQAVIQQVRPHYGQRTVAERLRSLLHSRVHPSEIAESHRFCNRVQDAYTLRCCPQVHGVANDTIDFVEDVITTEMNSATDNPLVFADQGEIISGGNFHGEYPAKMLDYLAIGVHELASMSERRMERLVNPAYSELPAFLVKEGGINSGFMMAHCTAASLVSENKVLCHPSSVDSLPTSAGQEDHVSMGGFSARKAIKVVENVEKARDFLMCWWGFQFRKLKGTNTLQNVKPWDKDRYLSADIEIALQLVKEGKIWEVAEPYMNHYFRTISCQETSSDVASPTASALTHDGDPPRVKRMKLDD